jgi:class 3 adenylate cyclase
MCPHDVEQIPTLGLDVRAGIHTGECERAGDKLAGLAVNVGARVSAAAGPGEVLVSGTVKDLVAGSGIEFEDRGAHELLKGVPGEWRLYAVSTP